MGFCIRDGRTFQRERLMNVFSSFDHRTWSLLYLNSSTMYLGVSKTLEESTLPEEQRDQYCTVERLDESTNDVA